MKCIVQNNGLTATINSVVLLHQKNGNFSLHIDTKEKWLKTLEGFSDGPKVSDKGVTIYFNEVPHDITTQVELISENEEDAAILRLGLAKISGRYGASYLLYPELVSDKQQVLWSNE